MTADQDHDGFDGSRRERRAVLRERREHELSVTTAGPNPTLADLRRLLAAAEQAGTPDSAQFELDELTDGPGRVLRLREVATDVTALSADPRTGDFLVRVNLPDGQSPEKTAQQIADELRWHGRIPNRTAERESDRAGGGSALG